MSSRDRSRSHRRSRSISSRRSLRRSRTRSRERRYSRHRSRSNSRNKRRPYGRSRTRTRSRSRSSINRRRKASSSSSSTSSNEVVEIIPPIRSDDPKYVNSRLFVGKLPKDFSSTELTDYFKRYGQIIDAVAHTKGYGFVQFSKREDALTAVENESGSVIKGVKVDIRMAAEGGRYANSSSKYRGREPDRRDARGASVPGRERSPAARRSPVRERAEPFPPYREPLPPRDDPYYADPYRRPPVPLDDRYDRFDDPYRRRDPYDDPYARDPYYPPPPRRAPLPGPPVPASTIECEIIMLHPQLRGYADKIHDKLKAIKLVCGILSVPADQPLQKQIEDMARHGVLYAIVINSQNEVHSSVILNILHGTPQEHRNMPLDDAIALISKTFEAYLKERSEKLRAAALPPVAVAAPFIPPPSDVSYLLNLLADNRQLTVIELERVIVYLKSRRDKMLDAEVRPPPNENALITPKPSPAEQEQEELKSKILSILNRGGTAPANVPASYGDRAVKLDQPSPVIHQRANPSMINFDSPSVQQALDNLIQSGPNLLKNISPGVAQSSQANNNGRLATANPSSPGYGGRLATQPTGYGAAPGGYAARPESEAGYGSHHTGSAQMYGATGHGAAQPPGMRRY